MKNNKQLGKCLVHSCFALAIAAMAWLPNQALAQGKGRATKLMKVQTVEDLQKVEAGDIVVMSCPKCKDSYATVVEKTFKAVKPEEMNNVTIHLCPSCDTKIVTKGQGKQATHQVVHTCKTCGSTDVSCCVIKKGSLPTPGMTEEKK